MYITKYPELAQVAQEAGVDWIFVDLEFIGKNLRQEKRNTVISAHTIEDVKNIRNVVNASKLLVRINPIGDWSEKEINQTIEAGADIVMLPYFKAPEEVKIFLSHVNKRAQTCLLIETLSAVKNIDEILALGNIDFIHIGLNDIHIERKTDFMFEFLADGLLDELIEKIKKYNIPYGFGGMAKVDELKPKGKSIIAEHYRLGSTGVILSRSFSYPLKIDNYKKNSNIFIEEVKKIREYEGFLSTQDISFFEQNRLYAQKKIYEVKEGVRRKNAKG
jgi:hypothetical protein